MKKKDGRFRGGAYAQWGIEQGNQKNGAGLVLVYTYLIPGQCWDRQLDGLMMIIIIIVIIIMVNGILIK